MDNGLLADALAARLALVLPALEIIAEAGDVLIRAADRSSYERACLADLADQTGTGRPVRNIGTGSGAKDPPVAAVPA